MRFLHSSSRGNTLVRAFGSQLFPECFPIMHLWWLVGDVRALFTNPLLLQAQPWEALALE